jgi:hypothetical protein
MRQFVISMEDDEYDFLLSLANGGRTVQANTELYKMAQRMSVRGFVTGGYPINWVNYECYLTPIGHTIVDSVQALEPHGKR